MTQQAQHTPKLHREPDCANIVSDDPRFGLDCWFNEGKEAEAIVFADQVVRAYNCYDGLLVALERMVEAYWDNSVDHLPPPQVVVAAKAAIAKARAATMSKP